ncbi:alpha/beta hydrolase family protein [Streptomyces sp. BK022]|uniref:alpha/beta fold hydrolase n=1 Tax=Streptomyces sp. BK022 TaxID=2512123 RepID=UPI00102A27D6|nr:alpha/beta hydrolase [Streptomyces sp. BK022]RZU37342.1 alpha/beta hydrolase family protein [Streptomyces sp. BK022]
MVNFVLVPGARLGAWAWNDVVPHLREAGHGVHPLTLSGLAEKQGLPAGQQTHVQDIVDEVVGRDLREVVLVGHSYAGVPVGQAAERIGDRLAHTVFLDSSVPADGESFAGHWPELEASLASNDGFWPPAPASHFAGHDLTEQQIARIVAGCTPHPGRTLTEPAALTGPLSTLKATYVLCAPGGEEPDDEVARLVADGHWRLVRMDTGHWPMFSRPRELARVLLDTAGE